MTDQLRVSRQRILRAAQALAVCASLGVTMLAQSGSGVMSAMGGMEGKKPAAPESTSLSVSYNGETVSFTPAQLQAMPQMTVHVHNEHTKADESYTGVPLANLIAQAGFKVEPATHRTMLRSYVQAEGTDHYWVLYSLMEVEPTEHAGNVIVATAVDGHTLGADGQLKLVCTEDKKPQRWVRNLAAISVKTAE